jgi:hypothetical protein
VALSSAFNDRRAPNSCVPGVLDKVYTIGDQEIFVKIMTSIIEYWAKCNRLIVRPAIDITQERLAEIEYISLSHRRGDLVQISITRGDRTKSDYLRHTIACCNRRELSKIDLQDILAEPLEFIGEFNNKSDYENVIKRIEKENTNNTRTQLCRI